MATPTVKNEKLDTNPLRISQQIQNLLLRFHYVCDLGAILEG